MLKNLILDIPLSPFIIFKSAQFSKTEDPVEILSFPIQHFVGKSISFSSEYVCDISIIVIFYVFYIDLPINMHFHN